MMLRLKETIMRTTLALDDDLREARRFTSLRETSALVRDVRNR